MGSLIIFSTLLIVALLATALTLWIGARIVKSQRATLGRAFAVTSLLALINIAMIFLFSNVRRAPAYSVFEAAITELIPLGLTLVLATALIQRFNPITLGPDEFFVLGDFSSRASDSRYSGPVPRDRILGVAEWRYWPPSRMRFLRP